MLTEIAIGFIIGALIGWIWNRYISSPRYGVDGKKETNEYMEKKYGKDWINQITNKKKK